MLVIVMIIQTWWTADSQAGAALLSWPSHPHPTPTASGMRIGREATMTADRLGAVVVSLHAPQRRVLS